MTLSRLRGSVSFALLCLALPCAARAETILVITPAASAGTAALAAEFATDVTRHLNRPPDLLAVPLDPTSPVIRRAVRLRAMFPAEVAAPNEFGNAQHLANLLRMDRYLAGSFTRQTGGKLIVSLQLGSSAARNSLPIETPAPELGAEGGGPGQADQLDQFAKNVADAVAAKINASRPQIILPPPAEDHWRQAQQLLAGKNLDAAAGEMRAAISLAPDVGEYQAGLADMLLGQGKKVQALQAYEDAATASPYNSEIRIGLGRARAANGDLSGAVTAYRQAVELLPDRPEAHMVLGRLLAEVGEKREGIHQLELALAEKQWDAADLLGDLYLSEGDAANAKRVLSEAVAAVPNRARTRERLAAVQLKEGAQFAIQTLLGVFHTAGALGGQARLTGATAVEREASSILPLVETAPAAELDDLRLRAQAAADLADALSAGGAGGTIQRKEVAALNDIAQAITERQHGSAVGDIEVLLEHARELLGLQKAPPPLLPAPAAPADPTSSLP